MGVPGFVLEKPKDPGEDDVDEEFAHLLVWHNDIRNRAERGQMFEPVSLSEIGEYKREFLAELGIRMTAFDWDMICRLDWVWMDSQPTTPEEIKARARKKAQTRH